MSKIKIEGEELIYRGNYLNYYKKKFSTSHGDDNYEMVKRDCSNIAAVLILTKEQEVILIRNYRIPLEAYVLEIPAGLGDIEGEDLIELAKREMLEESGYVSNDIVYLGTVVTSAGITNERVQLYLARDAVCKTNTLNLDDTEDIKVEKVFLSEFDSFLEKEMLSGTLIDPKVFLTYKYLF